MTRTPSFALVAVLFLLAPTTHAAPAPDAPYSATAKSTRTGDLFTVSIKIVQNKEGIGPDGNKTMLTSTLSAPQIKLKEGQRAQVAMGEITSREKPNNDLDSGTKVDIISVKGRDDLLMVTTVIDHGLTIWADAATVQLSAPAKK